MTLTCLLLTILFPGLCQKVCVYGVFLNKSESSLLIRNTIIVILSFQYLGNYQWINLYILMIWIPKEAGNCFKSNITETSLLVEN